MNFDLLEKTILIFWDSKENFNNPSTQAKIGIDLFKCVYQVYSLSEMNKIIDNNQDESQLFLCLVHLFHEGHTGYYKFKNNKVLKSYPNLKYYYISSSPRNVVLKGADELDIYSYDGYHERIGNSFILQTKKEITGERKSEITPLGSAHIRSEDKFEYAIITALFLDEYEEIEPLFKWTGERITGTRRFKTGHLIEDPLIKVVADFAPSTGMVESAILATQIVDLFAPKYLFMTGVCAGKKGTNFGDIIVAKQIFMIQKGKLSDLKDQHGKKIEIFDSQKNLVNIDSLYDASGQNVPVRVEKFEVEHDSMIEMKPLLVSTLESSIPSIKEKINKELKPFQREIDIHFEPMACTTMVINKEDFFETSVKTIHRRTMALEMESYAVARACRYANDGDTQCVIVKSVMDNMTNKNDDEKKFAARTSAMFLKRLIYDKYLV